MTLLLVLAGGAAGAPARYLLDAWVQSRHRGRYPWGTFVVNVLGSLLLGVVAGAVAAGGAGTAVAAAVGTGLCGAFTTFSTFGFEAVRLVEDGRWRLAASYVVASVAVGLLAVSAGWELGRLLR